MPARPLALTIPIVTVCPTPNGFPIASTTSPTSTKSLSVTVIAGNFLPSTLITATSVWGSAPTTFAS